jgi:division protein CdvB (Snf7/Vps24/ESCRT-III family)
MTAKITEKENAIFKKVVDALQKHDTDAAKAHANELVEVRKISKMLNQTKMALEQVALRLTTITDMGDVMTTLVPAISSVKGLKSNLGKFIPGADSEMGNMQSLLEGLMGSLQGSGTNINLDAGSEPEVEQILKEASALAENQVSDRLPSGDWSSKA